MTITTAQLNSLRQERDRLQELLALQRECSELSAKLMLGDARHVARIRAVTETVCEFYGVSMEQIMGESRESLIALSRHVVWHMCRFKLGLSFSVMATVFNRHHTSFIHGCRRVSNLIETDNGFADDMNALGCEVNRRISVKPMNHKPSTTPCNTRIREYARS